MFFQPPEKDPSKTSQKHKSTRKKRKKQKQKNKKKEANQINLTLANTMSTWAENFTMSATWQLKHQVAMWKARATALEYENQVLRETLRQCYVSPGRSRGTNIGTTYTSNVNNTNIQLSDYEQSYMETSTRACRHESDIDPSEDQAEEESEFELEISEEYMAFLRQNFEYRKAREERKKREAEEARKKEEDDMNPQPAKDRVEEFKELYGESWQRIAALETYMQSEFMSLCDINKPSHWPNIPLRL